MAPSPAPADCLAFLIRHAATENNLAKPPRLQGNQVDGPLSAHGRWQAEQTAERLANSDVKFVYCSPMKRAQQTAQAVANRHDLGVLEEPSMVEIDVGQWEGRSWSEIERDEPEAYQQFMQDPATYGYRGGESLQDLRDRVVPAFCEILARHRGERIAVVAHNVVNRVILAHVLEFPLARARELKQDNCGINVIRLRDDSLKLITLNEVSHLGWNSDPK